jgi:hypothetical protein
MKTGIVLAILAVANTLAVGGLYHSLHQPLVVSRAEAAPLVAPAVASSVTFHDEVVTAPVIRHHSRRVIPVDRTCDFPARPLEQGTGSVRGWCSK